MILLIVLQIMPQPKNNPNHQVLWTASDGLGLIFFLTSSPILDGQKKINPNRQMLFTAPDDWGYFWAGV